MGVQAQLTRVRTTSHTPLQVLQGGGLESPTKPKGRPKKNSIPTSEQLTEQERAKEAEKPVDVPGEAGDQSHED